MSDQVKDIKPFKQVPITDKNSVLTITGAEFVAMQNAVNIFKSAVEASKSVFDRNLNEGNIIVKYVQQDGTEISEEEASEYLKKASEYLKNNEKPSN